MTLDEIRKVLSDRRNVAWSVPGAGARARWTTMCDAADALLAVVDALPKCASHCGETATALTEAGTFRCDAHKNVYTWYSLPYADALRAIARKP